MVKYQKSENIMTVSVVIVGVNRFAEVNHFLIQLETSLQTHHVDSTLKRRGNGRLHVVSTWNPRGVFVGLEIMVTLLNG